MSSSKKVRLTFEMEEGIRDRILRLRTDTGACSMTGVIRKALKVYAFVLEEEAAGAKLIAHYRDGSKAVLKIV